MGIATGILAVLWGRGRCGGRADRGGGIVWKLTINVCNWHNIGFFPRATTQDPPLYFGIFTFGDEAGSPLLEIFDG
jgi:hypothetical protein